MNNVAKFVFFLFFSLNSFADYAGHGQGSVSPELLKKYAPSAIKSETANKLKKMLAIAAPGIGQLSPDKKTLYFSWKVTGQTHLWKINGPQKFPQQLTSGSDSVSLVDITHDEKSLILQIDSNGQEDPGLFLLDVKSGLIKELFKKEKVRAFYGFMTKDSRFIYFSTNDTKPDAYNIYKLNLSTLEKELILQGDALWSIADYKNDGQSILLQKATGSLTSEYYNYETLNKKLTPVIGQESKNDYQVLYGAEDNQYIVLFPKDNFKRLYSLNLKDPKNLELSLKLISDPKLNYDINQFDIDSNRQRILYNINRDGYTELLAMNAKNFKPIKVPSFKNSNQVLWGATSKDSQVTMLGVVSSKSPLVGFSYNWSNQKLTQWVLPSAPEVDLGNFADEELLNFETQDKTKIPMFVRFPKGCKVSKNCPVIVKFHGGPEAQSTAGFDVVAQAFVNEGFVFVEPNVRGSDGYGKEWIDLDNGPKREAVVSDIEDAAIWIKKNWSINPEKPIKVGVYGGSYGGYSTLMAMTKFAGRYDAGVSVVGMSNLLTFLNNTAPYRRILRISEYGDPIKDKESLIRLSPSTYIDRVKDPLLIIQGATDPRVPAGEAIQIHESLKKKKISSELILFADEGHGTQKIENKILELGHAIEFFNKHLK